MVGAATRTQLCGKILSVGDYVEVDYKSGGSIKGNIVELWGLEEDNHLQGRVSSGWCFHDFDTITKHDSVADDVAEIPGFEGTREALQNLGI